MLSRKLYIYSQWLFILKFWFKKKKFSRKKEQRIETALTVRLAEWLIRSPRRVMWVRIPHRAIICVIIVQSWCYFVSITLYVCIGTRGTGKLIHVWFSLKKGGICITYEHGID